MLRGKRSNSGKAGDTVGDRRAFIDLSAAIAEKCDCVRYPGPCRKRQHPFQFVQQLRVIGGIIESSESSLRKCVSLKGKAHSHGKTAIIRYRPLIRKQKIDPAEANL